eukprot:scaffold17793_cov131-Isochrysis_galbana.AAC.8
MGGHADPPCSLPVDRRPPHVSLTEGCFTVLTFTAWAHRLGRRVGGVCSVHPRGVLHVYFYVFDAVEVSSYYGVFGQKLAVCQCSAGFWVAAGPEPMSSFDCWCLAPESTLRHLWTAQIVRRRSVVGSGSWFTGVCRQFLSSIVQGRVCGACASAMLMHTVSLGAGVLRALLERAKLLFSIVDMASVNGAAFRQVRVACETHTGVFWQPAHRRSPRGWLWAWAWLRAVA